MASSKRRQTQNPGSFRMNFRPPTNESQRCDPPRGTKPTTQATSIKEVFTLMALHVCKKSIFFNTDLKVGIYLAALFLVSLICDFAPIPKSYMSRSDNIFNSYFVKYAWGWNLVFLIPFAALTTYVYCCGNKDKIIKTHAPRILIATCAWYFWTNFFNFIESSFGKCNAKSLSSKQACLKAGYFWNGLDISGHSFILIYGSLVLIEECRCIMNWESIRDFIRNEEHYRSTRDTTVSNNPLRNLTNEQFTVLKESYEKFTPYIRGLFIAMTLLQILWDVMLVCTMIYYHIMIEKFIGGAVAILQWFVTYRYWFSLNKVQPGLPGEGLFKYIKDKSAPPPFPAARKRTGSVVNGKDIPKFMGMPLYTNQSNPSRNTPSEVPPEETSTR